MTLAGQYAELGEARAGKVFKDIVANNGVSMRKGHTLLTQLVVSGEIPMALTVYNYKAEQLKNKGAPIDWFTIGPAIARPNGVGVAKKAPHPHAAVLFYDFEISEEGQKILAGRDFVPTSRRVDTPLNKVPMKFVDARIALDEFQKWEKLYGELFTKGAPANEKERTWARNRTTAARRTASSCAASRAVQPEGRAHAAASMPRVIKGKDLLFNDGRSPSASTSSSRGRPHADAARH